MASEITRQDSSKRLLHAVHLLITLLLFYTGLIMYKPMFNFLAFGQLKLIPGIHKIMGAIFIVTPIILAITEFGRFKHFISAVFIDWSADDKLWLKRSWKLLLWARTDMPPQGEYDTGEKLGFTLMMISSLGITISGLLIWFADRYPLRFIRWIQPFHDISMYGLVIALLFHAYLGLGIFPAYRGFFRLMFGDGKISLARARKIWPKWVDE